MRSIRSTSTTRRHCPSRSRVAIVSWEQPRQGMGREAGGTLRGTEVGKQGESKARETEAQEAGRHAVMHAGMYAVMHVVMYVVMHAVMQPASQAATQPSAMSKVPP